MLSHLRDTAIQALGKIKNAGITLEEIVNSLVPDNNKVAVDPEIETERQSILKTLRALSGERVLGAYPNLTRDQVVMLERAARCAPALKKIAIALNGFEKINVRDAAIAGGAQIVKGGARQRSKKLDASFISKLRNRPYCVEYSASYLERAADALHKHLETSRGIVFRNLVRLLPITVMDYCHNQRFNSDKQRQQAIEYVWQMLVQELTVTPAIPPFPVHSEAMLASIGSIWVILQRKGSKPSVVAHELRHIASRLDSTRRRRRMAITRTEEM